MAQLSRPYQIGLVAIALLAAAWLLLFQGHHSSTSGSSSTPPPAQPAHSAPTQGTAGQAAGHGSASSLGSLGHAIEKARGAVTTSQKNAHELESKSAQASSATQPTSKAPSASSSTASTAPAGSAASHAPSASAGVPSAEPAKPKSSSPALARQRAVESQLAGGHIALILFWNPKGSDDNAVHRAVGRLPHGLRVSVNDARSNEVAAFGSITRGVQVYGTPTLLVVNRKGQVTTLTGLQDPYTIAQAVREARQS